MKIQILRINHLQVRHFIPGQGVLKTCYLMQWNNPFVDKNAQTSNTHLLTNVAKVCGKSEKWPLIIETSSIHFFVRGSSYQTIWGSFFCWQDHGKSYLFCLTKKHLGACWAFISFPGCPLHLFCGFCLCVGLVSFTFFQRLVRLEEAHHILPGRWQLYRLAMT